MANPAPTINQINAFNATQGTTIDFNIIGGTELVRSNRIYIYDLSDNSLICTHLYVSTESIHELPPNTDGSIVYESGKSSADFVNGAQYYAQIQTFTDIGGTEGGSGLSVAKMFWCLDDPTLTIDTIPSTISTTSYNVSATYNANTSVVSNIIQQYQFSLYSATGSLSQSSGVVVGNGEQQGTSTAYDISYNFTGLSVGSSYYVVVDVTTTQGMSVSTQSGTFTVSIDTPTLGEATVVNNACDGYISVTSNLSSEYGGSGSGEIVSFETDSENVFTKLQVTFSPTQSGTGTPSPSNVRPIYGVGGVEVDVVGVNLFDGKTFDGYIDNANGNKAGIAPYACTDFISVVGNEKYYIKTEQNAAAWGAWYDENKNYISGVTGYVLGKEVIAPSDAKFLRLTIKNQNTGNIETFGVNYPSTIVDFVPYTETTVSQSFDVSLTPTSKDTDPYLFKAVGDVYGDRLEEDIVGGTVNWNQLVANADFSNGNANWGTSGLSFTVTNGVVECTMANSSYGSNLIRSTKEKSVAGHKYFASVEAKIDANATSLTNLFWGVRGHLILSDVSKTSFVKLESVINCTASNDIFLIGNGTSGAAGDKYFITKPQVYDLTAMFGSTIADYVYSLEQATAGSGIAWLKSYGFFTKPYYEYDAGTLKSVNPTAHKMVGINAWDEEWESGTYNWTTGEKVATTASIRSKNYIPCFQNTEYCIGAPVKSTTYLRFAYYDSSKSFISASSWQNGVATITTPTNCCYMGLAVATSVYGTTYNHDICINISNSEVNGEYYLYEEHTYDLGNETLNGLFQLVDNKLKAYGDVRHAEGGTDRKFALVDLGTLNYTYDSTATYPYFRSDGLASVIKPVLSHSGFGKMLCEKYVTATENQGYLGTATHCISLTTWGQIRIRDTAYTDATAFKTAMSGVYLVYELLTPTTEQTDPFEQIQEVSKYGTLEYITNNDVPVGHNTTYMTRDIFGGTLDLVSGQLVVDRVMVTFDGTESWLKSSSALNGFYHGMGNAMKSNGLLVADKFEYTPYVQTYFQNYGMCYTDYSVSFNVDPSVIGGTTIEDWKSWLANNPLEAVYELATPLTYQLTPQQIQTLIGQNNVWSEQGNIELSYHIPITNLLVKRQDVDDISGNWLTLYSQPIEQASDMDFTFIDFLNQYGKTYKYALVPLLTQTQSGVEVEVEGGYTVSDEVQSIFDGVFVSDSTGSQKCKANVGYGNVNMNQSVGSITPIGSQYPIIVTNSNNRYHNGSISGMIVPDDYYYNGNLSRIDMVNKRNELEQFLTNKRAKIIKDWNSNIWLVMIMDNIDCSFDNNYGMGIVTFNANWLEVGDPTNQEDLQATGLVDVGGV